MLDPINNKLKMSIEQKNIEWDKEAMWLDIEKELPKKKRRVGVFAILGLIVLVLGTSLSYYLITNKADENNKINIAQTDTFINETPLRSSKTENNTSENIITTQHAQYVDPFTEKASTSHPDNTSVINKELSVTTSDTNIARFNEKTNTYLNSPSIDHNYQNEEKSINRYPQISDDLIQQITQNEKNSRTKYEDIALMQMPYNLNFTPNIPEIDLTRAYRPIVIQPSALPWTIMPYVGAYVFQKSYANSSEQSAGLSSAYSPLESIQLGISIKKHIQPKWAIISGLELLYDSEKLDFLTQKTYKNSANQDSAYYFVNQQNQEIYLSGEVEKRTTETQQILSYNTKLDIAVPLYLSFDITPKFSIYAGQSIRITAFEQGYTLLDESQFASIESQFFDTKSLDYYLDVGVNYSWNITSDIRFNARPTIRRQINTSVDAANYQFKRHYYGLNVGFEFKI